LPTTQEAITNAIEGDTVFVRVGTYYGHVVVNKTFSLASEDGSTMTLTADD
jgi:nitrous oxidase accessory protein NosD